MLTLSTWSIDLTICDQSTGPELLTIFRNGPGRATFYVGGGTPAQARELAAELLAIADQIDAKVAADAKFSEQFTAAMLADEREAA